MVFTGIMLYCLLHPAVMVSGTLLPGNHPILASPMLIREIVLIHVCNNSLLITLPRMIYPW